MDIIGNNKLIAEFDGKFIERVGEFRQHIYHGFNLKDHGVVTCLPEHLGYDKQWNWIMPVVEKIESMGYQFKMCRRRVTIEKDKSFESVSVRVIKQESKFQSVYMAVIEFIKWYNKSISK